jgi:ATP-dependent DNA helicase RecQ
MADFPGLPIDSTVEAAPGAVGSSAPMTQGTRLPLEHYLARFGLREFRPGQRDVIQTVLGGQDCLCVMPTGGGKSLCYQLPAVARPGLTLVVSPLIALMQDQVQQLEQLGIPATFINSTLDLASQQDRLERMTRGEYALVYVAAERFRSPRFLDAIRAIQVRLLAVDEAHCISEWGHDFRPDYTKLGIARQRLGNPTTIALTATATPAVRRDIVEQLHLHRARTFVTGFARPNLRFEVQHHTRTLAKQRALLEFLRQAHGSGIVYASTRKGAEEVAQMISSETGRTTAVYHAGLLKEDRLQAQQQFMSGKAQIVAATTAFGMGIDKPDVRFVVHYNLPGSLEAYYQEAGRAGRDGQPSRCLLLFMKNDRAIQEFFIESSYPAPEVVRQVYEFLQAQEGDPIELSQQELKELLQLPISAEGVGTCERLLEKAGVLERLEPSDNRAMVNIRSDLPTLVDLLPRQATTRRKVLQQVEKLAGPRRFEPVYVHLRELAARCDMESAAVSKVLHELKELADFDYVPPFRGRAVHLLEKHRPFDELEIDFAELQRRKDDEYEKLDKVVEYATRTACRQQAILEYFGQKDNPRCRRCDNCSSDWTADKAAALPAVDELPAIHDSGRILQAVRMALSGVARTKGRFGKRLVGQMLRGSAAGRVTDLGLNRLSTFGLLRGLGREQVDELLNRLQSAGFLEQVDTDARRPRLQLTPSGWGVMRGEQALPDDFSLPTEMVNALPPVQKRENRSSRLGAQSAKSSPATSPKPAQERPADGGPQAASPSDGSAHPSASGTTPQASRLTPQTSIVGQPPSVPPSASLSRPRYYWTWRMLKAGLSPQECAAARGLQLRDVIDDALQAISFGYAVERTWFWPPKETRRLEEALIAGGPEKAQQYLASLPSDEALKEAALFLKCAGQSQRR